MVSREIRPAIAHELPRGKTPPGRGTHRSVPAGTPDELSMRRERPHRGDRSQEGCQGTNSRSERATIPHETSSPRAKRVATTARIPTALSQGKGSSADLLQGRRMTRRLLVPLKWTSRERDCLIARGLLVFAVSRVAPLPVSAREPGAAQIAAETSRISTSVQGTEKRFALPLADDASENGPRFLIRRSASRMSSASGASATACGLPFFVFVGKRPCLCPRSRSRPIPSRGLPQCAARQQPQLQTRAD